MEPAKDAIAAALNHDWKTAIKLNLLILKSEPKNIDALNRLGRAYMESGQKTKSFTVYKKVLRLDKFNHIAQKSLELLKTNQISPSGKPLNSTSTSLPVFLEEPGVTKTITITRPGDTKTISRLHPGDSVSLSAREHCVSITNDQNEYIGRLPDDIASRLRLFIKAGNRYSAWIRSVDFQALSAGKPAIKVFIKEISRATKYRLTPSFPLTEKLSYAAFTPPELIHETKPNIAATGEENDDVYSREDFDENADNDSSSPLQDSDD